MLLKTCRIGSATCQKRSLAKLCVNSSNKFSAQPWTDYQSKLNSNDVFHNLLKTQALLNGEWVNAYDNEKTFEVRDKASLELIATVPNMTESETNDAINAAQQSLKSWQNDYTIHQRCDIVAKIANLMVLYKEPLARILTAESGKPLAEARAEVGSSINFFKYFSEEGRRLEGDIVATNKLDRRIFVTNQPVGVCGIITPWNFPAGMIARKLAPLLAVGCSAVIKPASNTPLSALAIGQICDEAGVPAGVVNILTSNYRQAIGDELCNNKIVRKLSFTGSTHIGQQLYGQCASTMKKISMELGGNAPFIVFDDADIDAAVQGAYVSKFRNSGQTCVCTNRFYVQSKVYDEFTTKFVDFLRNEIDFGKNIGHGFNEDTKMGPLINAGAADKVEAHIGNIVDEINGEILLGGTKQNVDDLDSDNFFQPTVIANLNCNTEQRLNIMNRKMLITNEETFGPLAALISFEDDQQIIDIANNTDYGLASYFYTKDVSRAFRVTEQLEYGMVGVNSGLLSTEIAPFGGVKYSGLGREGSKYGLNEYVNMKYMCLEGI